MGFVLALGRGPGLDLVSLFWTMICAVQSRMNLFGREGGLVSALAAGSVCVGGQEALLLLSGGWMLGEVV